MPIYANLQRFIGGTPEKIDQEFARALKTKPMRARNVARYIVASCLEISEEAVHANLPALYALVRQLAGK